MNAIDGITENARIGPCGPGFQAGNPSLANAPRFNPAALDDDEDNREVVAERDVELIDLRGEERDIQ